MIRPLPPIDPVTKEFWDGCQQEKLLIQKCGSCGTLNFYPRALCKKCHSDHLEYVEMSGRGTLYSYTIVHRAPGKTFDSQVPYAVALVDLEEGPRLLANIVNYSQIGIGMKLSSVFLTTEEGFKLPAFTPVSEKGEEG